MGEYVKAFFPHVSFRLRDMLYNAHTHTRTQCKRTQTQFFVNNNLGKC